MFGAMQGRPVLISRLIEFAVRNHSDPSIVLRRVGGNPRYRSSVQKRSISLRLILPVQYRHAALTAASRAS